MRLVLTVKFLTGLIRLYLKRSSYVNINSSLYVPFVHSCGIPQGSVLGPILFIIYILPIKSIFLKFPHIHYHHYTDDLQIYTSFPPSSNPESIQLSIYNCINELTKWFANNLLSLNISKTDTIILSRPRELQFTFKYNTSIFNLPSHFPISNYTRYYFRHSFQYHRANSK